MNKMIIKGWFILIGAILLTVLFNIVLWLKVKVSPKTIDIFFVAWFTLPYVIIGTLFITDIIRRKYFNNTSLLLSSIINICTMFYVYFISPDPFIAFYFPILQIIAYFIIRSHWPPSRNQSN